MPEQFGDKQYDATPHRRQKAREEGQLPRSQDLASAVVLVGGLTAMLLLGRRLYEFLGNLARHQLGSVPELENDLGTISVQAGAVGRELASAMLPLLAVIVIAAVLVNLAQVGFLFLPQKLAFDLNRVNPLSGFQRLFSLPSAARFGFGLFKVVIVGIVAGLSVWGQGDEILALVGASVPEIAVFLFQTVFWTSLKIAAALMILALLDYLFQRWKSEQDLKMTHREIQEEMKTLQGDPQIIARRRQVQRQLAMNRLSSDVPGATAVVTNPTELAIALKYDIDTMAAPVVVAKGAGVVAQRIRRLALESGVPIVERKELARVLYKEAEVGKPIPTEQFAAVAEVLRYVYQLQGRPLPRAAA
ncbi:MAG: EscU/YscU/HrcU family type III secretion system export apparatus switch protein [Planctomycetes bacterium]|nr:EscU/YscU/HrcU family type III secretion system export apparatus switch protein [Planctomycetota bacterium]